MTIGSSYLGRLLVIVHRDEDENIPDHQRPQSRATRKEEL